MLWNYSLEDIIRGYKESEENYHCVICGAQYEKGMIYESPAKLLDAYGAVRDHVKKEHGTIADYLLQHKAENMGISDIQKQILQFISAGKTDKEISGIVGIAPSTVRNHRFKLREKEKQAKLFLAMMQSLESKGKRKIAASDNGEILEIHNAAAMVDDRYTITQQERLKTIRTYMDETGALKQFPAREKKKIIVLTEIMKNFKTGEAYTELEINRILKRVYEEDYPSVRRALIEYGFMERSTDCKVYRVKE